MMEVMEKNLERLEELRDCLEERYGTYVDEFGCMIIEKNFNSLEEEKEFLMAKELEEIYGKEIEEKEILKVLRKIKEQGWNLGEIFLWLKESKENFIELKKILSILEEETKEEEEKEILEILVDPKKLAGFSLTKSLTKALSIEEKSEEDENLNEIKENSFRLVSRIPIKVVIKEEIETVLRCMIQDMIFNSSGKEYIGDLSLLTMEDEERIASLIEKIENLLKNRLRGLFRKIEKLEEFHRKLKKKKISFKEIKKIERELIVFGKKIYLLGKIVRNRLKRLGFQSKGTYQQIYFLIRQIVDEYFEMFWVKYKEIKKIIRKRKKNFIKFYQKKFYQKIKLSKN